MNQLQKLVDLIALTTIAMVFSVPIGVLALLVIAFLGLK